MNSTSNTRTMLQMKDLPRLMEHRLPKEDNITFPTTGFFETHGPDAVLPKPVDVHARAVKEQGLEEYWFPKEDESCMVRFDDLGVLVKFGKNRDKLVAEGQFLWTLQRKIRRVDAPETYGWVASGHLGYTYLYMELLSGVPLDSIWGSLGEDARFDLGEELQAIVAELREFTGFGFIGGIGRGPLCCVVEDLDSRDVASCPRPAQGPFYSVGAFHSWTCHMAKRTFQVSLPYGGNVRDAWRRSCRASLPEDNRVILTHGALSLANVMVTSQAPYEVVGIVDWGQAGWYPAYWKESRARLATELCSEGRLCWGPDVGEWLSEVFATGTSASGGERERRALEESQKYTRLFRL